MEFIEEMIQRIRIFSPAISAYLDGELYLNEVDDMSDEYPLHSLFPRILEMVVQELKDLGIIVNIDADEVYENSIITSAVISLREIFDKNNLILVLTKNKEIERRITGLINSEDVKDGDHVLLITDILYNLDNVYAFRYKDLYRLEERYSSNDLFIQHVNACLDKIIPRSTATDEAVVQYCQVGKAIQLLNKYWNDLFDFLTNTGLNPIPYENKDNYFKQFASKWMNVEKASSWYWVLTLTKEDFQNRNIVEAHRALLNNIETQCPHLYPDSHVSYGLDDLTCFYIAYTLVAWSLIREPLKPVQNLLFDGWQVKNGRTAVKNQIYTVYNFVENMLRKQKLDASTVDSMREWNTKMLQQLLGLTSEYARIAS